MNTYQQIFRSSALIGSASVINILIGIAKVKILAVLLGPAGIGIMGLYQNIMATAATLSGCGLESSGVRQIAAAQEDRKLLALIRRALWWANVLLGAIGMSLLWLLREPLAEWVFHDAAYAGQIGWLGLGVFLSLLVSARMAWLQGMRQIGDVARVNILGALLGALLGVTLVWLFGSAAIHWFVIAAPASSLVFAHWYAVRLHGTERAHDWPALSRQWRAMFAIGLPLMAAGLLTLLTQLVARSWVIRDLGVEAGGYFQAAWSISTTYIGFVLGAMAVDYLPRLTGAIRDPARVRSLVNEQTEMALLMAAPVLLAMLALAPWVIELLYAESFMPATEILRWQVMGDVFKVIGWPMGFIVLALGRGDLFIVTQLNWNAIYLLCLWLGMESMGLLVVGVGFLIAYVLQVGLVRVVVGRLVGFVSDGRNLGLFATLLAASVGIMLLGGSAPEYVVPVGLLVSALCAGYSLWRLNRLLDLRDALRGRGWLRRRGRGEGEEDGKYP